jgi:hypothetical protein
MFSDLHLTRERVLAVLRYDPETGLFWWRDRGAAPNFKRKLLARPAGCLSNGYVRIQIDGLAVLAHRLAWLVMTGVMPDVEVDHRNLIRNDNRWKNLRLATSAQNRQNTRARRGNRCGLKGVSRNNRGWKALIQHDKKQHYLGTFDNAEEAHAAYAAAAERLHGEFARAA